MATADQIAELRRLVDEPTQDPYTDDILDVRIDAHGDQDIRLLAASIWREKAAGAAGLVDINEGSSSRKLSQLHKHALEMAGRLDAAALTEVSESRRGTRTRRIERQ